MKAYLGGESVSVRYAESEFSGLRILIDGQRNSFHAEIAEGMQSELSIQVFGGLCGFGFLLMGWRNSFNAENAEIGEGYKVKYHRKGAAKISNDR